MAVLVCLDSNLLIIKGLPVLDLDPETTDKVITFVIKAKPIRDLHIS